MTIQEIDKVTPELAYRLTDIWADSVLATHEFLSREDFDQIKAALPEFFPCFEALLVYFDDDVPFGFLATQGRRIEALFLRNAMRGKGFGRELVLYAQRRYNLDAVTVNEQNPQATRFYEKLGFRVVKRTETDEQGRPYPLLYMELQKNATR